MDSEEHFKGRDIYFDRLTGCRSRDGLLFDLSIAIMDAGRLEGRYRNRFLCIDIDNFQSFVDRHGFGLSDQVLIRIADNLRSLYSDSEIYRYEGDEFIVSGTDVINPRIAQGVDVKLKFAVVTVDTRVAVGRHHRATRWVMLHIHSGIVRSTEKGIRISCADRSAEGIG